MRYNMFAEIFIFAAFYAVAFVAHLIVAARTKDADGAADRAHRFAMVVAVALKAAHAALHDYAIHVAEALVHFAAR